jgi:hypothetical protein
MGGRSWSDDEYKDRARTRAATGAKTFAYSDDVATGKVKDAIHPSLNPKGVGMRESRDSDVHPRAVPIIFLGDVTGSMATVPRRLQQELPKLMGLLISKGFCAHPAILVGAIGDATCDRAPLQVGQFESDIAVETDLTNLYLEGQGGGQDTESYELALYFVARHTAHDHWDKRGERGYLFITGDERPYPFVNPTQVHDVIGDALGEAITVEQIMEAVQERYHVFFILPKGTNNFHSTPMRKRWQGLVGEHFLVLDDPAGICELIAAQIGIFEGAIDKDDVAGALKAVGTSAAVAESVSRAIVPAAHGPSAPAQALPSSGAPSGLAKF